MTGHVHAIPLPSEVVEGVGLDSRSAILLWNVALDAARSQRQLATALHLPANRIVEMVDALEARGWLERRVTAEDRRTRELHLTRKAGRLLTA